MSKVQPGGLEPKVSSKKGNLHVATHDDEDTTEFNDSRKSQGISSYGPSSSSSFSSPSGSVSKFDSSSSMNKDRACGKSPSPRKSILNMIGSFIVRNGSDTSKASSSHDSYSSNMSSPTAHGPQSFSQAYSASASMSHQPSSLNSPSFELGTSLEIKRYGSGTTSDLMKSSCVAVSSSNSQTAALESSKHVPGSSSSHIIDGNECKVSPLALVSGPRVPRNESPSKSATNSHEGGQMRNKSHSEQEDSGQLRKQSLSAGDSEGSSSYLRRSMIALGGAAEALSSSHGNKSPRSEKSAERSRADDQQSQSRSGDRTPYTTRSSERPPTMSPTVGMSKVSYAGTRRRTINREWNEDPHLDDLAGASTRNANEGATILYNFLSQHGSKVTANPKAFLQFEELVDSTLQKFPNEENLKMELVKQGWNCEKKIFEEIFRDGALIRVDIELLRQFLGTLYLAAFSNINTKEVEKYWSDEKEDYEEYELDKEALVNCFCPNLLYDHLLHRQSGTTSPAGQSAQVNVGVYSTKFTGACLLVDISGFTKLSSACCIAGVTGLEKLHRITSGVLAYLVSLVYENGGDVVYFAGDALICVFRAIAATSKGTTMGGKAQRKHGNNANDEIQKAIIRAVKCAISLKDYEGHDLTVHIGLSCGEMCMTTLGGYGGRWSYLLNGPCISELSSCLDSALPKQVVMTNSCADYLRNALGRFVASFTSRELESGNHMLLTLSIQVSYPSQGSRFLTLPKRADLDNMIKSFVPPNVTNAIEAGSLNTISELREVSTMFLSLDSYSVELYSDPAPLQSFFLLVQQAIQETGGFMRQFLIDDKGCVLIVMWGVPSFSHTNNASRAIDCALSITTKAVSIGHKCSIGITTGSVFCGAIGSVIRRDYVGIGDTVNLSARLMSKAKGRVLADEATYQKLPRMGQEHMEMVESMQMKGYSHPINPWSVRDFKDMPRLSFSEEELSMIQHTAIRKDIAQILQCQIDLMVPTTTVSKTAMGSFCINAPQMLQSRTLSGIRQQMEEAVQLSAVRNSSNDSADERSHSNRAHHSGGSALSPIMSRSASIKGSFSQGTDESKDREHIFRARYAPTANSSKTRSPRREDVKFLIVRGPPGSGKTTAAQHFKEYAKRRGVKAVYVRASAGDDSNPYRIIKQIFVKIVGREFFAVSYQQRMTMIELLRIAYPGIDLNDVNSKLSYLAEVLRFNWGSRGLQSNKQPREAHNCCFHALMAMIIKAQPMVIIVEDAHFCDELTWLHLKYLLNVSANVTVLLTVKDSSQFTVRADREQRPSLGGTLKLASPTNGNRSRGNSSEVARMIFGTTDSSNSNTITPPLHPGSATPPVPSTTIMKKTLGPSKFGLKKMMSDSFHAISTNDTTTIVDINAMSEDDVKHVLVTMLRSDQVSDSLVAYVYELSGGNPFWCKAIAGYILESGYDAFLASFENRQAGVDDRALDLLVLCRFEKLNAVQQAVIKHASVIGDEFSAEEVSSALPSAIVPTKLDELLITLVDGGFLFMIDQDERLFTFQNQLIRDVFYDLVPPSEASRIHDAVARYIEMAHANDLSPYYATLSYHFAMSQRGRTDAFKYTVKAADQAIQQGAFADGLVYSYAAFSMILTLVEVRALRHVVNKAIQALNPKTIVQRVSSRLNRTLGGASLSEEDQYHKLKASLDAKILHISEASKAMRGGSSTNSAVNVHTPSNSIEVSRRASEDGIASAIIGKKGTASFDEHPHSAVRTIRADSNDYVDSRVASVNGSPTKYRAGGISTGGDHASNELNPAEEGSYKSSIGRSFDHHSHHSHHSHSGAKSVSLIPEIAPSPTGSKLGASFEEFSTGGAGLQQNVEISLEPSALGLVAVTSRRRYSTEVETPVGCCGFW